MFASIKFDSSIGMARVTPLRTLSTLMLTAVVVLIAQPAAAQTAPAAVTLSDTPLLARPTIPGNLVLPLSVEFPTGVTSAHIGAYDTTRPRLGYFDPKKCYEYVYYPTEDAAAGQLRHFKPAGEAAANYNCSGRWSGNFLNWATMQTIDPFRWALTGGNRVVDSTSVTILEKAWASGQGGGNDYFPNRTLGNAALIQQSTPFAWNEFKMRIWGLGNVMRFTQDGNPNDAGTPYTGAGGNTNTVYEVTARVRVCVDAATAEANCVRYGTVDVPIYKPEGLIQKYSERIRYSAFGYLNDSRIERDAGVLRARQKFVAPQKPRPGLPSVANAYQEWRADTGQLIANPDNPATPDADNPAVDAYGVAVTNSGVINYLNKFGQSGQYKGFDPVGELYYAALRYLRNEGNVPAWTDAGNADAPTRATWADAFPVITDWRDPILYSCQANFILGIGDVNTHADKNVPGNTPRAQEPDKPGEITVVGTTDALARTNEVGVIEGIGNGSLGTINTYNACCNNNSALMAGLAYDAHINDIRADLPGKQTVKTFWVDVLEAQKYRKNNQYYLATKYGGFAVPDNYDPASTDANGPAAVFGNLNNWNANGQTLTVGSALTTGTVVDNGNWGAGANRRPDTYFTAGTPDALVAGLTEAFNKIANDLTSTTTSFSLVAPQITQADNISYSAQFTSGSWVGSLTASDLDFNAAGAATLTRIWTTDTTLTTQLAVVGTNNGWDTNRRVVTLSGTGGVPFRWASLSAAQQGALDTPYGAGTDGQAYLNYLRGDQANEVGAAGTPLGYRSRNFAAFATAANPKGTILLGDIAGSKVTAVGNPIARYSDAANPGYAAFVAAETGRRKMVFVGANDGMLHAFNGEITGATAGQEMFAYVPSALFNGPTSPAADGLVSRGNPTFEHKALVDATAEVFDIDIARTGGPIDAATTAQWRSVLIGGLGKGGRSYYAINVSATAPAAITDTEANWAGRVMWEFPNPAVTGHASALSRMGFTYGKPLVTKTAKWGWVVILPSGYNSTDGGSFLFFINPASGALLETVAVGYPALNSSGVPSGGLAHVQAYRRDFADNTAESVYAADLQGNVWRVDVRSATDAYTATRIAELNTAAGTDQSVTTRLLVEIDPASGRRYVLVGTGRLLDTTEVANPAEQTFYAITDGTRALYDPSNTVITRNDLFNITDNLTGVNVNPPTTGRGWFLNLGTSAAGVGWRVVLDPVTNAGRVSFASTLPTTGDPCVEGNSRVYSIDIGKGKSVLANNDAFVPYSNLVLDIRPLCIGSNCTLYVGTGGATGTGGGQITKVSEKPLTVPGLRRLNWRELQIVQ